MTMRYFQSETAVYAYDGDNQNDAPLIAAAQQAGWQEITGHWPPVPTLDQQRADRLAVLRTACSAAMTGGYSSAALGAVHTYPSGTVDQQNMAASVLSSLLPGLAADWSTPFWCADVAGVWGFRTHSAAQIQQAGNDGKAWVLACQKQLADLRGALALADSPEALQAVGWSNPGW